MRMIYKYPLKIADSQLVDLPADAYVLKVDEQSGELFVWALVDTEAQTEKREFRIVGTGNPVPDDLNLRYAKDAGITAKDYMFFHLNSVVMSTGLVWHVFLRSL